MFVVTLIYERPLAEIEAVTAVHREFLDIYYKRGIFLASGPKVPRDGGIIIVNSKVTRSELEAILEDDPYRRQKLSRYEIVEFNPVKYNPGIAELL